MHSLALLEPSSSTDSKGIDWGAESNSAISMISTQKSGLPSPNSFQTTDVRQSDRCQDRCQVPVSSRVPVYTRDGGVGSRNDGVRVTESRLDVPKNRFQIVYVDFVARPLLVRFCDLEQTRVLRTPSHGTLSGMTYHHATIGIDLFCALIISVVANSRNQRRQAASAARPARHISDHCVGIPFHLAFPPSHISIHEN